MSEAYVFPHQRKESGVYTNTGGLTKRELFAAMAMMGALASNRGTKFVIMDAISFADDLIDALKEEK